MTLHRRMLLGLGLAAGLAIPSMAMAEDTIKVGVLATFEGAFTVLGEDSMRGAVMAVDDFGGKVAGKKIEIIKGSSDGSPDSAVRAIRKLVEQDGAKVIVGPLSGDEGLAVKDYLKTKPDVTVVNGTSAAQDTTLRDPAPNFFRFSTDGAQWMAGLGDYAYNTKGYKRVATLAEDYSFPYTQVFGFMAPFCKAGGHVVKKFWVPIGTKDFSSVIAAMPDNIDAIYVVLGGADSVNFLTQYQQGRPDDPRIQGQDPRCCHRYAVRWPDRRRQQGAGMAEVRCVLQKAAECLPVAVAVCARLLHQHDGAPDRPAEGQCRRVGWWRQVAHDVGKPSARHADRQSLVGQEPQRDRRQLPDGGEQERRWHALQQADQGHSAGEPDAGHSRSGFPRAGKG
jgi:hypothetical protein